MANHVRIDDGIKRGPRNSRLAVAAREGTYRPAISAEQKAEIMKDACAGIAAGQEIEEIAERNKIKAGTLRYWLLNDAEADAAREALVDQELARCGDLLREAQDPMQLARAREEFRYWSWVAERRDARRYGHKQEIAINNTGDLGDRLRRARERVVETESEKTSPVRN